MSHVLLQQQTPNSTSLVLIGVGVVLLVYMMILRPMMRKKRDPLADKPFSMSLSEQRSVERQMSNLLVELSEMARQVTAQIDTRSKKLEMLIEQADERIATLREASQAVGDGPTSSNGGIERLAPLPPPMPTTTQIVPEPNIESVDPRHAEIYALSDQGHPPRDIAAQLGRPNGEVELILALRPKRA